MQKTNTLTNFAIRFYAHNLGVMDNGQFKKTLPIIIEK